ncbi:ABC transporter substrate-binding protein [Lichenifustis flavocetrariae]|uniref:ABC transporter substrate-binding protein n=1 Tax=Lichenifustis flavocetrariae TaxID=2949735 RepID=A0AA41YZV2_9HYPH|nr:ABC transporter substrate-binding protein [Lichenifustis flavocetrariae]MCW6510168.1 ABC transporter substrate-binding protein [Lichenifustis flavocetrariae]
MQDSDLLFGALSRRDALRYAVLATGSGLTADLLRSTAAFAVTPGTLVVAAPGTPQSLDNEYDGSLGTIDAIGQLYDSLVAYRKIPDPKHPDVMREDIVDNPSLPGDADLEGRLAESWDVAPDGLSLRMHLRKGVLSNWGNELTADDVKWTWDRKFALNAIGGFQVGLMALATPDSVKVEDRYTVTFHPSQPNPIMLKIQTHRYANIFDSVKCKQMATADDPWARKFLENDSAGFGPYRLAAITRGQQAVFKARADYYLGKPAIDTVIYKEVPTSSARVALLQGGAVDIAQALQPLEIKQLEKAPGVKVETVAASSMMWIILNAKIAPFDKPEVRQAMNYAFPRAQVIASIFQNIASPLNGCMPNIYPGFNGTFDHYGYDLEKAKALLLKAGLPDGFKMQISYNAGDPVQEPIAILFQTSLRKIGVELTLHKVPAGTYFNEVSARKQPMLFFVDAPWTADPVFALRLYFYSKSFVDYSNYANPEVDKLIEAGAQMTDLGKRTELMQKIQEIVMADAPWVFVASPNYTMARRDTVRGFTYYTSNSINFADFSAQA